VFEKRKGGCYCSLSEKKICYLIGKEGKERKMYTGAKKKEGKNNRCLRGKKKKRKDIEVRKIREKRRLLLFSEQWNIRWQKNHQMEEPKKY
jgi:hypothetical protein